MSSFSDEMEEIKSLIISNKSLAYSTLQLLQQQSTNHLSAVQTLANSSQTLISAIAVDISHEDEEIAAQALKCLGFMIYHPCIVASIKDDVANIIMGELVKVIIATKTKSICNLGVWCISMQQFDVSFLSSHFHSILRAIVHALDNPFGSLSTTFEAMQVVMKLLTHLAEIMKESSHIWSPPIYRRLLSIDKKERDMSERCLLKIRSVIIPPPAALSKALVKDMKWKLLTGMKDLLNQGVKVQALQAWGWFIRLLGLRALKSRLLINDMLKIPEQTFSDQNPQVQIASLVAWEGLIDALIHHSMITCETNEVVENSIQQFQATGEISCQVQASAFSKRLKLLMTPLIGTISSKCDTSVHLSCFNTWCYLLHKLDLSIKHTLVIELVLEPILEAVFRTGPDTKTPWLWGLCLDLLDDFITSKCRTLEYESSSHVSHHSSVRASIGSISGKCFVKQHPFKWFPWGINQLDFFLKMINIILNHSSLATNTLGSRSSLFDDALRIFRSLLKGLQIELKSSSINYTDIVLCLNTLLRFVKETCENLNSCSSCTSTSIPFLLAIVDELEPSILGSPLYKVVLDIKCIENLQSIKDTKCAQFFSVSSTSYMEMVSPTVYLITLCVCTVIQLTSDAVRTELLLQGLHKFFKSILFSCNPLENLQVAVGLLYKYVDHGNLLLWITIAEALKDCISGIQDFSTFGMEPDVICFPGFYQLLSYPFAAWSSWLQTWASEKFKGSTEESFVFTQRNHDIERVTEVWESVFWALCSSKCSATGSLSGNLCSMLNWCMDEYITLIRCGTELDLCCSDRNPDFFALSGNAVSCILEVVSEAIMDADKNNQAEPHVSSCFKCVLGFASRFLKHSREKLQSGPLDILPVTKRLFSALANFVSCLHSEQTILSTYEIINSSLLQWLSPGGLQDAIINDQLQLWTETFDCLRRSKPPIIFDSPFLKLQSPLLEKALDHPNSAISEITIAFWNSTYGETVNLDYPESLLDLLDRLSRNGKIKLQKKSLPFLVKCSSITELAAQRWKVTVTHNRSTKRVEIVENRMNQIEDSDKLCSNGKRKRLELTEHQKEVRRAQQGRAMDCNGHGPGIRTYTSLDFSQGNEDSQESQDIRDPDSIMEMLRRVT